MTRLQTSRTKQTSPPRDSTIPETSFLDERVVLAAEVDEREDDAGHAEVGRGLKEREPDAADRGRERRAVVREERRHRVAGEVIVEEPIPGRMRELAGDGQLARGGRSADEDEPHDDLPSRAGAPAHANARDDLGRRRHEIVEVDVEETIGRGAPGLAGPRQGALEVRRNDRGDGDRVDRRGVERVVRLEEPAKRGEASRVVAVDLHDLRVRERAEQRAEPEEVRTALEHPAPPSAPAPEDPKLIAVEAVDLVPRVVAERGEPVLVAVGRAVVERSSARRATSRAARSTLPARRSRPDEARGARGRRDGLRRARRRAAPAARRAPRRPGGHTPSPTGAAR